MIRARGAALAAAAITVASVLAGCVAPAAGPAPEPTPRVVTDTEAELLAVVRFNNFDAGARSISADLDDRGHALHLDGWVDYTTHTGVALLSVDGAHDRVLVWDGALVATSPVTSEELASSSSSLPPIPESVEGWAATKLDAAAAPLHALLVVLASLGADRPENPLLLRQGGALWLREDAVDGEPVTVFAGPSSSAAEGAIDPAAASVRYWIAESGLLRRLEVRLGDEWADVVLGDAGDVTVPKLLDEAVSG